MKEILQTATPIAMILMIIMIVAAAVMYFIALRIAATRDSYRVLRTALERDPSPAQINEARRNWPQVAQISEKLQVGEMKRLALQDEGKLSQKFEVGKATCRTFVILAVVCAAIFAFGTFYHPA